jgi:hypothetical protein
MFAGSQNKSYRPEKYRRQYDVSFYIAVAWPVPSLSGKMQLQLAPQLAKLLKDRPLRAIPPYNFTKSDKTVLRGFPEVRHPESSSFCHWPRTSKSEDSTAICCTGHQWRAFRRRSWFLTSSVGQRPVDWLRKSSCRNAGRSLVPRLALPHRRQRSSCRLIEDAIAILGRLLIVSHL